MKIFKLFFLVPALMLPLSLSGCEDAGEPDVIEDTETDTTAPDQPAAPAPVEEVDE